MPTSKLLYVPRPEPNRPHVNRAIWWSTMERLRENGGERVRDGLSMRSTLGIAVLLVLLVAAVLGSVSALSNHQENYDRRGSVPSTAR